MVTWIEKCFKAGVRIIDAQYITANIKVVISNMVLIYHNNSGYSYNNDDFMNNMTMCFCFKYEISLLYCPLLFPYYSGL